MVTHDPKLRLILILVVFAISGAVQADEGTRQLLSHLFPDSGSTMRPLIRPVQNFTDPVVVTVGLTVMKLFDLDFEGHSMTSYVWLSLEWVDYSLRWHPASNGGVD